ncbi:MAG: DUF433 domain-containing protein [Bacteroidetes bacterium]|nr:DUF433 domain-containing protein [Bacteroidota bacterium]
MNSYNKIIKISSDKRFGRPCIRNTRITVSDILGWLGSGMSFEEILQDFPELSREDIKASLMFAADRERKLQTI